MSKDFYFDLSLVLEFLGIFNDFDSHNFFLFVIIAFHALAEAAAPKSLDNFIPICNVVVEDYNVITVFIVISVIVLFKT